MKKLSAIFAAFFLPFAFCAITPLYAAGPLTQTAGSNMTGFNGNIGAMNNNNWNTLMNPGKGTPTADFGNCNSAILRCAQPKCSGCVSMDIAYPIVSGCVMSNDTCKNHGEPLIQMIAAQMVSSATAKANEQAASAQAAAAAQASAQSSQQMQQMQNQMQQMQSQMAEQAAASAAAVQAALEEQKQFAAEQAAAAAAAQSNAAQIAGANNASAAIAPTETAVALAAASGVSADVLAREQASGQIMSKLEDATDALAGLKKTMQNAFDYAGCDRNGSNCTGPKRIRAFKAKANEFFDPYETVLDEVYDALIMAQSLGVDITDIYMMLNGSCNVWGKYLCQGKNTTVAKCYNKGDLAYCNDGGYDDNGNPTGANKDIPGACGCTTAMNGKVAPVQQHCQLIQMLTSQEEVQQNWLYPEDGAKTNVQVACASDALENSGLFRNRKKQASIDIETLQRMIDQDAPARISQGDKDNFQSAAITRFCSVDDDDISTLSIMTQKKTLSTNRPGFGKICVKDTARTGSPLSPRQVSGAISAVKVSCEETNKYEGAEAENETAKNLRLEKIKQCNAELETKRIACNQSPGGSWDSGKQICKCSPAESYENSDGTDSPCKQITYDNKGTSGVQQTSNARGGGGRGQT